MVGGVDDLLGSRVGRALEAKQGNSCGEGFTYGQGFQLLQQQRLDLGGGCAGEEASETA